MIKIDVPKLLALAGDESEKLEKELYAFSYKTASSFELNLFLENEKIPRSIKKQVVADLFPGASRTFLALAGLLIEQDACRMIPRIAREYRGLLAKKSGKESYEIIFSSEPSTEELSAFDRKGFRYNFRVDPKILGGFILKSMKGSVLDCSMAGKLNKMKEEVLL
ncbi:hypothetical protein A2276_03660 [candidate division WOR-1 bacterium RIFOXYA12_FULL_43_27]|nr:MAG: hypothetical protein A2276_03660 [candidate division WOR-1 bacterium RIFOXYA12_FULL_43_27]OGC19209.1 MAG: hypothetical protein A2292_00675 [candidate division WOR-1 bacterium RIFOXYB2_FULL_46_45]OGC30198.1 MAG: hypothetical protein A2232_00675 [candidate division WOR-1 bacterium RIFOXYA2_FULL_46_56]